MRNVSVSNLFRVCFLAIIFCLSQQNLKAAEPTDRKGTIKGQILDQETKEVISYASISILDQSEKIVTGVLSDDKGSFHLKNIAFGSYTLQVSFVGYATVQKNITLSDADPIHQVEIFLAASASELEEVTVEGKKSLIENRIDKKIINVSEAMLADGKMATEVLNTLPEISVQSDGTISLRGETNVNVLIDGKPSQMDIKQALQSMPADAIDKVEVITNPSAKYNPEGLSGIINIITKKDRIQGLNGSVNVMAASRDKYSGSVNLNYRYKKFNIFGSAYFSDQHWHSEKEVKRNYTDTPALDFTQNYDDVSYSQWKNVRLGFDYFLDSLNTFTFSMANWGGFWKSHSNYSHRMLNAESVDNFFSRQDGDNSGTEWNFNYRRTLSKGSLEGDLYYVSGDNTLENYNTLKGVGGVEDQTLISINTPVSWAYASGALDYESALGEKAKIELGYKGEYTGGELNTINNSAYSDSDDDYIYDYSENLQALYASFMQQLGEKWSVKAGLRAEYADITGEMNGVVGGVEQDTSFHITYKSLFPSLYFQYKLNQENQFGISYSRRIQRPDVDNLIPIEFSNSLQDVEIGNPSLQPAYTNSIELQWNRMKEKYSLNASVYMRHTTDIIRQMSIYNAEKDRTERMPVNLGESVTGGLTLSGDIPATKWLNFSPSVNFYYLDITDDALGNTIPEDANPLNYSVKLNTDIKLPWGIDFQAVASYNGEQYDTQSIKDPFYYMNVSLQKRVLKDAGRISFEVQNLVYSGSYNNIYGEDFYESSFYDGENPIYRISFNYSFGGKFQGRTQRKLQGSGGM